MKRVVVTGLGAITPIGNTLEEFWNAAISGTSGANAITHFDPTRFKTRFACEVKNFDPLDFFDRRSTKRLDPFAQYALVASDEAIADAGLNDFNDLNKKRVGVIWSSGIGGLLTFQEEVRAYALLDQDKPPRFSPFFIPKMILDIAAGQIAIRNDYRGLNFAVVSACASSTNALIDAFNYLRLGTADAIVIGGSEASITEGGIGGFNAMKALSENNEEYETASRPFDLSRDGFVMGEGAGALVLETYEHAKKRGAKIYGEVKGGGMSCDAYHITAPHPDGHGARDVMVNALENAQMSIEEIDYINVHGTSTPLGDVSESKAILEVFGEHAYNVNISATKSMTGHLLGAAGAVESIIALLAIYNNIIPPTINHQTVDPAIDSKLNLTFNNAQKRPIKAALSNTFGFGGHNASVVLKKWEA